MSEDKSKIICFVVIVLFFWDGDCGFEVFMEKWYIKLDFVGGVYVFFGGCVDFGDILVVFVCCGCCDVEVLVVMGFE